MLLGAVVYGALSPLLLLMALIADVSGAGLRLRPHLRLVVGLAVVLTIECVGLGALALVHGLTVGRPSQRVAMTYAVQRAYVRAHFGSVAFLYDLRTEVEGDALATPGPLVVLIRHVSLLDVLVPGQFLASRHGLQLRYVLKRELLAEPCLDIAGHVLPNHFVARGSSDTGREVDAIRALKRGLGPHDGVLIYPEGTLFTKQRLAQRVAEAKSDAERERVRRLRHVLPCRTAGTLALLDEAPACDVLFVAHHGFEGLTDLPSLRSGALVGRRLRVRFWRERAEDVPTSAGAREAWLHEHWQRVDDWLDTIEA